MMWLGLKVFACCAFFWTLANGYRSASKREEAFVVLELHLHQPDPIAQRLTLLQRWRLECTLDSCITC